MQDAVATLRTHDEAALVMHPVRQQLLEGFREPRSAAEVARRLEQPRQRLGHHVRLLQEAGLLLQVGERRVGNFVEQLLQTSSRAYVIAPSALGAVAADPERVRDRFSSDYLVACAARIIDDLGELRRRADRQGKRVPSLALETEVRFASAEQQASFARELAAALAGLARKYHDQDAAGGRRFRFTIGGHPAVEIPPHPSEESTDEETIN